jgi:hypothetical protein
MDADTDFPLFNRGCSRTGKEKKKKKRKSLTCPDEEENASL